MLAGNKDYKKNDMPVAATFVSEKLRLKVWPIPVEMQMGVDGTVMRKPDTGVRLEFKDGRFLCENRKLLKLLMEDAAYGNVMHGYIPDPTDPTGFWRALGIIKTQSVTIVLNESQKPIKYGDIDFAKIKAAEGKEFEPLRQLT